MHDIRAHKGDLSFDHADGCETCEKIAKKKKGKAA